MTNEIAMPNAEFYETIRTILAEARRKTVASINTIMVEAYWRIGQRIVEEEQQGESRAEYGQKLLKELSRRLADEFGKGFSVANLKNFRQFYLTFSDLEKGYALRSELGWTHYRLIMRVENPQARDYYICEAAEHGWSTRQLERNIRSGWHQRLLETPDNQDEKNNTRPQNLLKDPYILEFLDLPGGEEARSQFLGSLCNHYRVWLNCRKNLSFLSARFFAHCLVDLYYDAPPVGKSFRDPLRPHPQAVEKHICTNLKRFFSVDNVSAYGLLFALHWFADFLFESRRISAAERDAQQNQWLKLYEKAKPVLCADSNWEFFTTFPEYPYAETSRDLNELEGMLG
ncbi:MAG: DUF1016 N-terminal domain-containing protein [Lentisphaeria bacterium]|nr:DUF1016 N-terminal domain-containing protein [Lentisphaeria bacterium]